MSFVRQPYADDTLWPESPSIARQAQAPHWLRGKETEETRRVEQAMSREQIASGFQLWRLNQLGQIAWAKEEAKGDDRILAREASESLDALAAAGRFTPKKRPEEPKEEGD